MFFAVIPHLCGGGMDAPGGGLYMLTRQPNKLPNHSRKQKEPPSAKATSKIFFKTKRQCFDYAKRSIFDFNRKCG